MLSYRYMFMDMDGSRNGTDEIDDQLIISRRLRLPGAPGDSTGT